MNKKLWSVVLGGATGLALAGAYYSHNSNNRRGAAANGAPSIDSVELAQQPYLGKWTFVEGTVKSTGGFNMGPAGSNGTNEASLAGKSMIIKVRKGGLWYSSEGNNCWEMLRVDSGSVEVNPGHTECGQTESDAEVPKRATTVKMSMSIDAQGKAHISGESQVSLQFKGTARELRFSYSGTATHEAGTTE